MIGDGYLTRCRSGEGLGDCGAFEVANSTAGALLVAGWRRYRVRIRALVIRVSGN